MGQNPSSGVNLTQAMKKMRITAMHSELDVLIKPTRHVSTPSSPFHKPSNSEKTSEYMAMNAPFENVTSSPESPSIQTLTYSNLNSALENRSTSASETPILATAKISSLELKNTTSSDEADTLIYDELSNEEIIEFLLSHQLPVIPITPASMCDNLDKFTDSHTHNRNSYGSFHKPPILAKYSAPSIDELISSLKKLH